MAEAPGERIDQESWLDFPGFAQEFLRRNAAYRVDCESALSDPAIGSAAREGIARRWGLCFPCRPAPGCGEDAGLLACPRLPLCGDPRYCARGRLDDPCVGRGTLGAGRSARRVMIERFARGRGRS